MEMLDKKAAATHFQLTSEKKDGDFCFLGRRPPLSELSKTSSVYIYNLRTVCDFYVNLSDGNTKGKPCDIRSSRLSPRPAARYRSGGFPLRGASERFRVRDLIACEFALQSPLYLSENEQPRGFPRIK